MNKRVKCRGCEASLVLWALICDVSASCTLKCPVCGDSETLSTLFPFSKASWLNASPEHSLSRLDVSL